MSDGFIDSIVRMEGHRVGKFIQDLAKYMPYAHLIGHKVAIPTDQKALPPPPSNEEQPTRPYTTRPYKGKWSRHKLSPQQKNALQAITNGASTIEEIRGITGMARQTIRCLNNLVRFKLIKEKNGTYTPVE